DDHRVVLRRKHRGGRPGLGRPPLPEQGGRPEAGPPFGAGGGPGGGGRRTRPPPPGGRVSGAAPRGPPGAPPQHVVSTGSPRRPGGERPSPRQPWCHSSPAPFPAAGSQTATPSWELTATRLPSGATARPVTGLLISTGAPTGSPPGKPTTVTARSPAVTSRSA